jgi:hypothetical protein
MARAPRNPFDRGGPARGARQQSALSPFRIPRGPSLPAPPRPAIFARGPRELQAARGVAERQGRAYPLPVPAADAVPGWRGGSTPEWAIFYTAWHIVKLTPLIDFEHQGQFLGGRNALGGFVPDFVFYAEAIALGIQGLYQHYEAGTATQQSDRLQAEDLGRFGLTMVWIDEDHALEAPEEYLRAALRGIDRSRLHLGLG